MKILIAPDSFKESLKASEVAHAIEEGVKMAIPDAECICVPMADGGEGTVDALVHATGGTIEKVTVRDPLMRQVDSFFGILGDGKTAVIEMAAASGLELLKEDERNPMETTTYGTGQLIKAALDKSCRTLVIGIGGSATNDGGAGMAQALGIRLLDKKMQSIGLGGGSLDHLANIDLVGLDERIENTKIIVASDVNNPLCGENGASNVYGPQKGATHEMIKILDENLNLFGKLLEEKYHIKIRELPGAGAAGGLGAGLVAFLHAELQPGFKIVKEITQLEDLVQRADLVITGEGRMDKQTMNGKTPYGVAGLAKKYQKPVIGISGTLGEDYQVLFQEGFDVLISIIDKPMSLESALGNASEMLKFASFNLLRTVKIGSGIK
jgi:glycerate kinase